MNSILLLNTERTGWPGIPDGSVWCQISSGIIAGFESCWHLFGLAQLNEHHVLVPVRSYVWP